GKQQNREASSLLMIRAINRKHSLLNQRKPSDSTAFRRMYSNLYGQPLNCHLLYVICMRAAGLLLPRVITQLLIMGLKYMEKTVHNLPQKMRKSLSIK